MNSGTSLQINDIVPRFIDLVFSVAKRRTGNVTLAEEATQLVFLRLTKSRPRFESESHLIAWLHRAAITISIDLWRAESRRIRREQEAVLMQQQNADDENLDALSGAIDDALNQLPDADRRAILLRFFASKPMRAVGEELGVSEDAAKMRVSRALDKLGDRLRAAGITSTAAVLLAFLSNNSVQAAPAPLAAKIASLPTAIPFPVVKLGLAIAAVCVLMFTIFVASKDQALQVNATTLAPTENAVDQPAAARNNALLQKAVPRLTLRLLNAETDAPVADALILVEYSQNNSTESHQTATDIGGVADIPEPAQGPLLVPTLYIFAEGYVPARATWNETLRLDPAQTFSGRVLDESGLPVEGVHIAVKSPDVSLSPNSISAFGRAEAAITSDAAGQWRLSSIPKWWSDTQIILSHPNFALTHANFQSRPTDPRTVDLTIKSGVALHGVIKDAAGTPIPFAKVRQATGFTRYGYLTSEPATQADAQGRYTLTRLLSERKDGLIQLDISADGYTQRLLQLNLPEPINRADVTLGKGAYLRGRVLDQHGNPASAYIQLETERTGVREFDWNAETDEQGRFEWASAPARATYRVNWRPNESALAAGLISPAMIFDSVATNLLANSAEHIIRVQLRELPRR